MGKGLIRPAARGDLNALREIEHAAGQQFRDYGLDHVADNEPPSVEVLASYADDSRAWVAVDDSGQPIGYILVDIIDAGGHIERVDVAPAHQGQGVGRALIEQVERWAISMNLSALTLTTFGQIPWNRPLYEHLGFRVLSQKQISKDLQAICDAEANHGLDPDLRVAMRLDLQA
jgi:GNAT superfamily N-acetyltransferase